MDSEGYPEDTELELIEKWEWMDTFGLIEYVKQRWAYADWGIKEKWAKNSHKDYVLLLELHTAGWSGNESIISALEKNWMFMSVCHKKWLTGGHFYFEINPKSYGYSLVSAYCNDNNISRQAIHKSKDKYDWIKVSHGKQFIKPKK